jgi:hypothetical protein
MKLLPNPPIVAKRARQVEFFAPAALMQSHDRVMLDQTEDA